MGIVGILIVPIGIFLFVQQYVFSGASFQSSILSMVAAVVGMIPEGLYLLASVALVVSVIRLASQKVLVHDMKCIEALARVDVLCVDKTGTITENEMQVSSVIPMEGFDPTRGVGLKAQISTLIAAMPEGNLTMQALKRYFKTPLKKNAEAVFPFSSTYKYCAAVFLDNAYVLGAPEFVLRGDYEKYRPLMESYSADGFRTVLFGRYEGVPDGQALTEPVIPMGLILLTNPIRRDAPETFRYFAQQGVAIKVISGDNPLTVSQIAAEAGIPGAENYVDASTLETEDALRSAAEQYTVFGRVTPEQKRLLVRALRSAGHTVGMTGDGVNDVLALKEADCSVAMASGCDAAAQVSQLVLLESDFSTMPSVVAEGRRVVNNIQRSASLFLVKNIFSFLMSVFSACFMLNYPLEPAQISLISMFTIGIPGFFLALQPNAEAIHGRFLSNVLIKALPAGLTDFLVVGALVIFGRVFGVNETDIDVVAGYIEPHARPQTAALVKGLETLPVKEIRHGEITLKEFDIDGALERKPQLILVDELAHTNAEGSRHAKRYQDVQELLKAGINVYTTVNVQHLESLNDTVASITGVFVRERIPDDVFDQADQVELVDIEPKDLLERMASGNIYREAQARQATANFFTVENLTALREIALRRCADRVNLLTESARIQSQGDYHIDEHILVCISSSPSNPKIIRTAARMASAFRGGFTALYVETPNASAMDEADRKRLRENMRLAQQLGATIETCHGEDIAYQIAEYARLSGVSKIVVGRSAATKKGIFSKPTLTERLIANAPNLDIHIIPDASANGNYRAKKARRRFLFPCRMW